MGLCHRLFILLFLLLQSCENTLVIPVKMSQVLSESPTMVNATITMQVSACVMQSDSSLQSAALAKTIEYARKLLPAAQYDRCFRKNISHFAVFSVPVQIGGSMGGDGISVTNAPRALMAVSVDRGIYGELVEIEMAESLPSLPAPQIVLQFHNDTDQVFKDIPVYGVYLDRRISGLHMKGLPISENRVTVRPDMVFDIHLSDASSHSAFANPPARVFGHVDTTK